MERGEILEFLQTADLTKFRCGCLYRMPDGLRDLVHF